MAKFLAVALIVLGGCAFAHGQDASREPVRLRKEALAAKPELFTSYGRSTSVDEGQLSAETCHVIVGQADQIATSVEGLKSVEARDLQIASTNLRKCATSDLPRADRDLAVGLYGETVSELERRRETGN